MEHSMKRNRKKSVLGLNIPHKKSLLTLCRGDWDLKLQVAHFKFVIFLNKNFNA
jgi:hypothetical protein